MKLKACAHSCKEWDACTCINFKFSTPLLLKNTPPCVKQQMSLLKVRPQNTLEFFLIYCTLGVEFFSGLALRGQSAFRSFRLIASFSFVQWKDKNCLFPVLWSQNLFNWFLIKYFYSPIFMKHWFLHAMTVYKLEKYLMHVCRYLQSKNQKKTCLVWAHNFIVSFR